MKPLVTSCESLDIRRLSREGFLTPLSKFTWIWKRPDGTVKGGIVVAVLREKLVLAYHQGGQPVQEIVPFQCSTAHGGGQRRWFQCPACRLRIAILYKSGVRFRCRECSGLAYPSQYPVRTGHNYGKRCHQ